MKGVFILKRIFKQADCSLLQKKKYEWSLSLYYLNLELVGAKSGWLKAVPTSESQVIFFIRSIIFKCLETTQQGKIQLQLNL